MKDAYWFKHDSNARHDFKMVALRAKHGAAGYGVYWMIIETLRETSGYKYPLKHLPSMSLDFAYPNVTQIITDCVDEFDLLEQDDEFVWSPALLNRMEKYDEIKQARVDSGRKGGQAKAKRSKSVASAKQTPTKSVAIRGEKSIEEKNIIRTEDGTAMTVVVLEAMKSKYGEFSNYPLEAKKAKHIVERAQTLHPSRIEAFVNAMLGCFWTQTQTNGPLKGKAFTPSTLDTEWIWNQTYEALRQKQKAGKSVVEEKIF